MIRVWPSVGPALLYHPVCSLEHLGGDFTNGQLLVE